MDDVMQLVSCVFVVGFVGRRELVEGSAAETELWNSPDLEEAVRVLKKVNHRLAHQKRRMKRRTRRVALS
jgi:hypothetical protein